ncbi:uncharacterized protein UHOD_12300 [Ustilago sp. UG-2017b]|nr:uncharacterized protein UHOD_12300 [Ustilago sp. UG-2017b]
MVRDLPQPEYDLLKKDGVSVPLRELFAAMMTNNVGTQNAVLATLEKQNGKSCCWCHQPFRSLLPAPSKGSLKPVTRGMMINHMWSCVKPDMYSKYKEACCEALACQPCWHKACCGQILPQDHKGLIHHILHQYNRICLTLEYLTCVPNRSYRCPFVINSRAEQYQWALHWQERQPSHLDVVQHLETAHGFPTIMSNMTKYCTWHNKWIFGHEQTNSHFEKHINALLRGYAKQEWCQQTCQFCLVDKALPAATRAHCFKEPHELVAHVCRVRIYPDHSPVCHCPFCNMQILTYDFTDHLKASRACKHRDNWISWVQSITPSPPPPAAMSSIQGAAQEEINASMAQVVTDAEEQVPLKRHLQPTCLTQCFRPAVMTAAASCWWFAMHDELVFRLGLYLVTAPSAGAFRGLLASGILKIPHIGEVKSWEMIFLIEGLITIVVAIIGYFTLIDSIHTAPWLTDVEKAFLQARLNYELVGQKELVDKTHKKLIWKGIASTTSLCCAMMFLLDNIAVQGAAVFLPTAVRGIFPAPRYTIIQQQLLTVPPNVAGAIATLAFAYCSAKFKIRSVFAISGAITMCIGYTMFLSSKNLYVRYAASFFATSGAFTQGALLPASAAVNANNDSERTGAIAVTVSPCPVAMLASICRRVSEA